MQQKILCRIFLFRRAALRFECELNELLAAGWRIRDICFHHRIIRTSVFVHLEKNGTPA